MAAPTTPAEALAQSLLQPKSVSENGRTIVNRDLKEIQDAMDRETASTSGKKNHMGLRFRQLVPPGAY